MRPTHTWHLLAVPLLLAPACAHRSAAPQAQAAATEARAQAAAAPAATSPASAADAGDTAPSSRTPAAPPGASPTPAPHLPAATRPADCGAGPARVREAGRTPRVLPELSGLVASRRHPGVFWAHNDSGEQPFFLTALDAEGRVLARFELADVRPVDVEDVAVAPCGERTCVVLADVGDARRSRDTVQLLRLPEPPELTSRALPVERLPFRYADGPRDAESLVAAPDGTLYVLDKPLGALANVYRVEGLAQGRVGEAVRVATLPASGLARRAATGASLSADGTVLVVRSYLGAWLWQGPGGVEALLRTPGREVPAPSQPQGEAVALLPDASGYLLGSEGVGAPLVRVDCATQPAP